MRHQQGVCQKLRIVENQNVNNLGLLVHEEHEGTIFMFFVVKKAGSKDST
jgi:hypothetical protein